MQIPKANTITRKFGPLPVWAWAGLVVAAWFLFLRGPHTAAGGTQLPYTPERGSGAQQPQSGQGSPTDNGNSDLLSALDGNSTAADALLAALQAGGQGGGYGATGGGAGSGTSATSAATVDSGVNNAPADSFAGATTTNTDPYSQPAVVSGGQTNADLPADQQLAGVPDNAYVIGGPAQVAPPVLFGSLPFGIPTTPTTQPTPTVVQPAPVDTGSVIMPLKAYVT